MTDKPAATPGRDRERISLRATRFLNSLTAMRTGLTLLVLLIALSAGGTILWPGVYQSFLFRLVAGLFCLSLALCSLRRLPVLWRTTFAPPPPEAPAASWPVYRRFAVQAPATDIAAVARAVLRRRGFRLTDHAAGLCADKGRLVPWGTLAVHLSLQLIVVGALHGRLSGYAGDIVLPVGGSHQLSPDRYPGLSAPVTMRLDRFDTVYNPDGTVADWVSNVTLEQHGREPLSRAIKVNHPLAHEGLMIYQMSHGSLFGAQLLAPDGAVIREAGLREREILAVDDASGLAIQPLHVTTRGRIAYVVYQRDRPFAWGASRPGENIALGGGAARFTVVTPCSGLQIKHDPGLPLVWSGFFLMAAGFFLSLYARRTTIVVAVAATRSGAEVSIASLDARSAPAVGAAADEIMAGLSARSGKDHR
jgi:cytochrome c biogenesis protein